MISPNLKDARPIPIGAKLNIVIDLEKKENKRKGKEGKKIRGKEGKKENKRKGRKRKEIERKRNEGEGKEDMKKVEKK